MIGGGSIWGLVAAVSLWAAWIGLVAIKWDWFAWRYVSRLERDERLAESDTGVGWEWGLIKFSVHRARARVYCTHVMDFGWLLIAIMVGSVFLCALPLLIALFARNAKEPCRAPSFRPPARTARRGFGLLS